MREGAKEDRRNPRLARPDPRMVALRHPNLSVRALATGPTKRGTDWNMLTAKEVTAFTSHILENFSTKGNILVLLINEWSLF